MEHREAELREVAPCDAQGDNPARFLRELRQLRDGAGLGQTELAVRAHYPRDAIKAAEAGPALPELPVLSAYVRGCGGAVTEWEERWRALTSSPALPLLPTRTAGCSDAATAGARIGSVSLAADAHDPSLVMAALSRVAHGIAVNPQPAPLSVPVPAASPMPLPSTAPEAVAAAPASLFGEGRLGASTVSAAPAATATVSAAHLSAAPDADWGAAAPPATAPPGLASVSTFSGPASTRRTLPSTPVIVAVVILLCLAAVLLAIFA